jgi:hypothetical protein
LPAPNPALRRQRPPRPASRWTICWPDDSYRQRYSLSRSQDTPKLLCLHVPTFLMVKFQMLARQGWALLKHKWSNEITITHISTRHALTGAPVTAWVPLKKITKKKAWKEIDSESEATSLSVWCKELEKKTISEHSTKWNHTHASHQFPQNSFGKQKRSGQKQHCSFSPDFKEALKSRVSAHVNHRKSKFRSAQESRRQPLSQLLHLLKVRTGRAWHIITYLFKIKNEEKNCEKAPAKFLSKSNSITESHNNQTS